APGEPVLRQRLVEKVTCVIAGEWPAGTVGPLQPGREPDDEQPRLRLSEGGHRGVEPTRLPAAPILAECLQARTERAVAIGPGGVAARAGRGRSLVLEIFVVAGSRVGALRCRTALQELRVALARLARFARRPLGRIASDLRLQFDDVEEDVCLAAQLVGHHG